MFKRLDENKGKLVWRSWFILLVELLGTFALVFEIIAPSSFGLFTDKYPVMEQIFGTYIMKAFWVAAFIWILVMLLRKVSVNLNPAVTLGEIIVGNDSVGLGLSKIFVQFVGAFGAAFAAYFIAQHLGTWSATSTMDAVAPHLSFSTIEQNLFGVQANYTSVDFINLGTISATTWLFSFVPYFLEALFTFILLISIFWGKNIGENARAFLIAAAVQVVVTLGISTGNTALNPARLIAPALVSTAMGGAQSMQFQVIFLAGELTAVMIFWLFANKANTAEGKTVPAITKQYKVVAGEMLAYKARYEWVSAGNKRLEDMKKDELLKASKKLKMDVSEQETRDDIEFQILETLIFGLETKDMSEKQKIKKIKEKQEVILKPEPKKEEPKKVEPKKEPVKKEPVKKAEPKKAPVKKEEPKKAPVKKAEPAKKPAPVKKAEPAKKPAPKPAAKPAQPKLTKEEIAKRDAMRAAAKAKLAKTMDGDSKISLDQIKKLKLTDIYGVGAKTMEYFNENGITDMVKLSNKDVSKMTKKFIEGLPTLRSFTYEMKEAKLHAIVEEAKHVVEELKNIK